MKILIINQALGYGGAQKQALVDANSLAEQGHQVTVGYYLSGDFVEQLDASIKRLKLISKSSIVSAVQVFFYLLTHKNDVVHTHQYWASKVGGIPGKMTGNRVVYNEHGLGKWRRWYHRTIIWILSHFADKIITSCNENSQLRHKLDKISRAKLQTVYNSFELHPNGYQPQIPTKDQHDVWVGYVGRFNKIKQLDLIIKIAKTITPQVQSLKFILVGDGQERAKLEQQIQDNNLEQSILLTGFCRAPYYYYQKFDMFILPSKIEGFSISLLEAGASSLPVVCFDVGGNKEIVIDRETGFLIPPFEIDEMGQKIIKLYQNPDLRNKFGRQAQQYVADNFSIDKRRNLLEQVYRGDYAEATL